MIVGISLVATGGMIAICGVGLAGAVMVKGARRWIRAQQAPPTAITGRKLGQAKVATTATSAWQSGMAGSRAR